MKTMLRMVVFVTMSLFIAASLMLTGCESEELTAQEILANSVSAMTDVSSYTMDYEMAMDIEVTGNGDTMTMTAEGDGTAIADIRNQKTQMVVDMTMDIPGAGTQQMSMEMYMIEEWQYVKMDIPGAGIQWSKMKIPYANMSDQITQLTALLTSSTSSSLLGSGTVNGTSCYILKIVPDIDALWQWMMSQQGSDFTGGIDFGNFDMSEMIKDFGCKYWVAKDNYMIMKSESEMSMEIDTETFSGEVEGLESMSMSMAMTMTFADFNKTIDIELPDEALDAEEMSIPQY